MACCISAFDLPTFLEHHCEKICNPKGTVLFSRGEKASGVFLVLSGRVGLDAGIDKAPARSFGTGALVGLPATLTKANYSMTATVTEDAELGFLSPQTLDSLMQNDPDVCQALLTLLSEGMLEIQQAQKALLHKKKQLAWEKRHAYPNRFCPDRHAVRPLRGPSHPSESSVLTGQEIGNKSWFFHLPRSTR
jgi:CRP-like cAMP-binding protein